MQNNDYDYQKQKNIEFKSKKGAEYLERLVVVCPVCHALQTMQSKGNLFWCSACGYETKFTTRGTLKPLNNEFQTEQNLHELSNWQSEFIQEKIATMQQTNSAEALFYDEAVTLKLGYKLDSLVDKIHGRMSIYLDRFEMLAADGRREIIPLEEITGAQVIKSQKFEFYRDGSLYHFDFSNKRASGYKYMLAVQKIRPQSAELE